MEEKNEEMEQQFVEIVGDDGKSIKCDVYDIVDFEDKTYALLLPVNEEEADDDAEVIVMEYVEEGDEAYFQNIEDEDEFNRVCEFIEHIDDDLEEEE